MKNVSIFICLCLASMALHATPADSTANKPRKKSQFRIVPVISYAPETRLLGGIGGLLPFQLGPADTGTHYSLVEAFVAYTQNNQDYIYVPYQVYTWHNKYYFEGEADYYNYSYYYWGIGTNRVPQELYNIRFPRLSLNAYRKITPHFFAGLDYYYENDVIWKTAEGGGLQKGNVLGSGGSANSGVGIDLLFDTRDSIYFPRKGWYIRVTSFANSPVLGATYSYNKLISDISWYTKLSRRMVLAMNEHTQLTQGDVPFTQMALVGGSKQMRGYYTGYYRDDNLTYLQAEMRIHLIGRISMVAFGSAGLLGNWNVFPETPGVICAEGIGLRYNYNVKHHINLRGDIGYGKTVEYYFTIQEAF